MRKRAADIKIPPNKWVQIGGDVNYEDYGLVIARYKQKYGLEKVAEELIDYYGGSTEPMSFSSLWEALEHEIPGESFTDWDENEIFC